MRAFRFFITTALASALALSAYALEPTNKELMDKITLLENTVSTLSKSMSSPAEGARQSATTFAQIEEVKEQLKQIRADLEQVQFENARLNDKVVKFSADTEFRISQLEKKKSDTAPDNKALDNIDTSLDNNVILQKGDASGADKSDNQSKNDDSDKPQDPYVAKKKKEIQIEQDYQDAYTALKEKDFKRSNQLFTAFIKKYPDSDFVGSAHYWVGEAFFYQNEFDKSAIEYLKGYQSNIRGPRAADNLLKLAKSLSKLEKRKAEACLTYKKLKKEFPNAQSTIKKQMQEDMKNLECK